MLYSDDEWDLKLILSFGMCPDFEIWDSAWSAVLHNGQGSMEKEAAAQSAGLKQVASNKQGWVQPLLA